VVSPNEDSVVVCRIHSDRLDRLPFVAVTMPPDVLIRNVVLDDGVSLAEVSPFVTGTCNAVLLAGRAPGEVWPRVSIRVGLARTEWHPPVFLFDRSPSDGGPRIVVGGRASEWLRR